MVSNISRWPGLQLTKRSRDGINGEFKKLLFNNSFSYQSIDDFIYFVHLALKNLKLNNSNSPIILSGNISAKVGTFKILKKYFKNIKFKTNFPKAAFSKELKLEKHYFDNLIYITV